MAIGPDDRALYAASYLEGWIVRYNTTTGARLGFSPLPGRGQDGVAARPSRDSAPRPVLALHS